MQIDVAGSTHVGMKRGHNEDNFVLMSDERLWVVADGMGGHASGEVASKLAIDEICEFFKFTSKDVDATWPFKMEKDRSYSANRLGTGIKVANRRIWEENHGPNSTGKDMGTTIVGMHIDTENRILVGHVGDSRVYRFRSGDIFQVTEDHSLLNQYLRDGKLKPEEVASFPYKNVILRALGMKDAVGVDVSEHEPLDGDVYLLCSDGLSGMISDQKMAEILKRTADLQKASDQMIDAANAAGGTDNVTCVLVRLKM